MYTTTTSPRINRGKDNLIEIHFIYNKNRTAFRLKKEVANKIKPNTLFNLYRLALTKLKLLPKTNLTIH